MLLYFSGLNNNNKSQPGPRLQDNFQADSAKIRKYWWSGFPDTSISSSRGDAQHHIDEEEDIYTSVEDCDDDEEGEEEEEYQDLNNAGGGAAAGGTTSTGTGPGGRKRSKGNRCPSHILAFSKFRVNWKVNPFALKRGRRPDPLMWPHFIVRMANPTIHEYGPHYSQFSDNIDMPEIVFWAPDIFHSK